MITIMMDQSFSDFSSRASLFLLLGGLKVSNKVNKSGIVTLPISLTSSLFLKLTELLFNSSSPMIPRQLNCSQMPFLIFLLKVSLLLSIDTEQPFNRKVLQIFQANYMASLPMGISCNCLGETQKSHFPPVCQTRIAMNLSREPKMALWMITGRVKPFLRCPTFEYPKL